LSSCLCWLFCILRLFWQALSFSYSYPSNYTFPQRRQLVEVKLYCI
jgi:hypothetical protein